jgi:hypothetical protein
MGLVAGELAELAGVLWTAACRCWFLQLPEGCDLIDHHALRDPIERKLPS